MYFTETSETNIGHLYSFFFLVFAADEAFVDKFIWLHNETGMNIPLFKDDQAKIQAVKSAYFTGQAS